MDKIDPLYYVRSSRIDLKEETRIKATSEEVQTWEESVQETNGKFKFYKYPFFSYIPMDVQLQLQISFPTFSFSLLRWAIMGI